MEHRRRRIANVAGVALGVVLVIGFGLGRVVGGGPPPAASCDDPVPWDGADEQVGDAAVAGPVAAVSTVEDVGGEPTFVNLGNAHPAPERFDVVIYDDVRAELDGPPEQLFGYGEICVVGHVRQRDGVPQIVLDAAWSIEAR